MSFKFGPPPKVISEIVSDDNSLNQKLNKYKKKLEKQTDKDLNKLVPDIEVKPVPHMIDGVQVKAGKIPQKTNLIREIMELTDVFKLADLKYLTVSGLQNILELHKLKAETQKVKEPLKIKPVVKRKEPELVKEEPLVINSDGIVLPEKSEPIIEKEKQDLFSKTKMLNYLINTNMYMLEQLKTI